MSSCGRRRSRRESGTIRPTRTRLLSSATRTVRRYTANSNTRNRIPGTNCTENAVSVLDFWVDTLLALQEVSGPRAPSLSLSPSRRRNAANFAISELEGRWPKRSSLAGFKHFLVSEAPRVGGWGSSAACLRFQRSKSTGNDGRESELRIGVPSRQSRV
eukprot:829899-Rhodomonas_salina.4